MSTGRFVYIDILRQVYPGGTLFANNNSEKTVFDFFLLGTFDAMKVNISINSEPASSDATKNWIQSLEVLQEQHKDRYKTVDMLFERQPLFLYTIDSEDVSGSRNMEEIKADGAPKDYVSDIFDHEQDERPIVLVLFQLDDRALSEDYSENSEQLHAFLTRFSNKISNVIPCTVTSKINYHVFYDMGAADIAVVFRAEKLMDVGTILHCLRCDPIDKRKPTIRIMSTCSHCGFPKLDYFDNNGYDANEVKSYCSRILKDEDVRFLTLLGTAYGLDDVMFGSNKSDFLLGEWDSKCEWSEKGTEEKEQSIYARCIEPLLNAEYAKNGIGFFKGAYTLPVVDADVLCPKDNENIKAKNRNAIKNDLNDYFQKNPPAQYKDNEARWADVYDAFAKTLFELKGNNLIYTSDVWDRIMRTYDEMSGTFLGLHKYLVRLCCGRFELDLYAALYHTFDAVAEITAKIRTNMDVVKDRLLDPNLSNTKRNLEKRIETILDNYLKDLAALVSEIQHLYSVLSVSPNTYLETYGCNMRSIAGASKLLFAYNGIVNTVAEEFNTLLYSEPKETASRDEMLVLPYRNVLNRTVGLFPYANPKRSMSYIQVDFSQMFKLRNTLYILLHECGHQTMNYDFRKNRYPYYIKASFLEVLYTSIKSLYDGIKNTIKVFLYEKDEFDKHLRELFLFSDDVYAEGSVLKQCSDKIINIIRQTTDTLSKNVVNDYQKYAKSIENEEADNASNAYLFVYERAHAEAWLAYDMKDYTESNLWRFICYILRKTIETYHNGIFAYDTTEAITSEILGVTDYRFAELQAFYGDLESLGASTVASINEKATSIYEELLPSMRPILSEMQSLFEEVYADIFAFYIMGLEKTSSAEEKSDYFDNYIQTLRDAAGAKSNYEFSRTGMILRFYLVSWIFELYNNDEERFAALTEKVKSCLENEQFQDETMRELDEIKSGKWDIFIEPLKDYAELCYANINNSTKDMSVTRKHIKALYSGAKPIDPSAKPDNPDINMGNFDSVMQEIDYFWRINTQRGLKWNNG